MEQTELKIEDLNKLFDEGESADKQAFAEMRTACLLYKGDHFKKNAKAFLERNNNTVDSETKIKLSENHAGVVCDRTMASILNQSPGVMFEPHSANERADVKDAELANSVKASYEARNQYSDNLDKWVNSFVVTGECFSLNYFDPTAGDVKAYKQKVNESGIPLFVHPTKGEVTFPIDENGSQLELARGEAIFSGEIKKEVIEPYDVIRPRSAKSIKESPWLTIRKMLGIDEVKALVKNHEDKDKILSEIKNNDQKTYQIFDNNEYSEVKDRVLVRYWFFRKCVKYPKGYFVVQIGQHKISEGELPYGVWPIAYGGFKHALGSARATGKIKDIRMAQTHLNFLISNEAYHMIALGDDKVFTQMGTKLVRGPTFNGIRSYTVNGPLPTVQPGRDAGQFKAAIDRQVSTIYRLADVEYETQENRIQDPLAMLYSGLKQKLKHARYASAFEQFLCEDWSIYIKLAKNYFDDDMIIKSVGKREAINIAEFKAMSDDGYRIKAKPVSGTLEEQLGIYIQSQQILQYVGKNLPQSVIAKIINNMPFLSKESIASDLLMTDKNIENDILAMDRGEFRAAYKDDDHSAYMAKLKTHMKSGEFKVLHPQIQQMYQVKYKQHEDFAAQNAAELQRAEQGFIPTGGGKVKFDLLDDNGKRMTADIASVQWFLKQLNSQGITQEMMQAQDEQTQINILNQANQLVQQQQGIGQPVGMQPSQPMPLR